MDEGPGETGPVAGRGPEWLKLPVAEAIDVAWDALRDVYDPELYLDVVALGLVYDVREENGAVVVEMTMTTPGCPASEVLPEMARAAIADALGNSAAVEVRVVWDPPWSPEMIDADAARSLGFRARQSGS
ncbi:MAG: metal-sulfur cluster assembly factor [Actinomycetota bacterium]|nr:metal-sulfur cluster assembly factor [Actinomycetota bacterium]